MFLNASASVRSVNGMLRSPLANYFTTSTSTMAMLAVVIDRSFDLHISEQASVSKSAQSSKPLGCKTMQKETF